MPRVVRALGLRSLLATVAVGLGSACVPLPSEPDVRGPEGALDKSDVSTTGATPAHGATRELVWIRNGAQIRIQNTRMCQRDDAAFGSCVRLSRRDRRELDRFFGAESFRRRWTAFVPCPQRVPNDSEAFQVTFADGEKIGRLLDREMGNPLPPSCDRATRDAVAGTADDLVKRYFN